MDYTDWQIICNLNLFKNITQMAKETYTSQPYLTQRIKRIEKELGVEIIKRNYKGVEFTPIGEYVLLQAKEEIHKYNLFKESLALMRDSMAGNIKITAPYIIGRYVLPSILAAFNSQYPLIKFKIITAHSGDVLNYVKSDVCHLGFIRGNNNKINADKEIIIEKSGLSIISKKRIKLESIERMNAIDYHRDKEFQRALIAWWQTYFNGKPNILIDVEDLESCIELVKLGLGYSILPELALKEEASLYKLPIFLKEKNDYTRFTKVIFSEKSLELPIVKRFHDFLLDYKIE